jgi:hypothetical protein
MNRPNITTRNYEFVINQKSVVTPPPTANPHKHCTVGRWVSLNTCGPILRQFVKLLPGIVGCNFTGSRTIKHFQINIRLKSRLVSSTIKKKNV